MQNFTAPYTKFHSTLYKISQHKIKILLIVRSFILSYCLITLYLLTALCTFYTPQEFRRPMK